MSVKTERGRKEPEGRTVQKRYFSNHGEATANKCCDSLDGQLSVRCLIAEIATLFDIALFSVP